MKEKRDLLFKHGRPLIRPLEIYDGDKYHKDIGILWVAYKRKPFHQFPENLTIEEFVEVIKRMTETGSMFMIDDRNREYKHTGPIAFVNIFTDGWTVEPHAVLFPWATTRNKIRGAVSLFQMLRYKKIGVCKVFSLIDSKPLFDKCVKYGVLHYVGHIPNGDIRGDEFLYSVKGKKHVR